MTNAHCNAIRVGSYILTVTPMAQDRVKLDIDRNVDSPIYRETIPVWLTRDEVRQMMALLALSLDLTSADPPHVTRLKAICERVRTKFAAPIEPVSPKCSYVTGLHRADKVIGVIEPKGAA